MPNKKNSFLKNVTESEDDGFFKKLSSPEAASAAWALPAEGELAVDVYETKKDIIVRAPIAGIKSEDLTLSLEGDVLTIRGARHDADKQNANTCAGNATGARFPDRSSSPLL